MGPLNILRGSYAALGDSYAAGAGAGSPIVFSCGRFSEAYPVQIAHSKHLNISDANIHYLACGGSDSRSVLIHQVPFIEKSDVITMTVGGNEVHFFSVLNACVYQWLPISSCEKELAESRALIESRSLIRKIDAVISESVKRKRSDALLLVTGYARFFNERTDLCDHVTFSRTRPLDYLTKDKRRALNQLVSLLNDVVRASADIHGAKYVDIDGIYEGHRFCEEGVHEPDIGRDDTWFFNLPAAGFQTDKQNEGLKLPIVIEADSDSQQRFIIRKLQWSTSDDDEIDGTLGFPDLETARTFHPTKFGHVAIADAIVQEIMQGK
ncbi:uncharacterized protein A1O9_11515 [Exophiala aquamarina CBS 119918]|uniref:SGNH hydrolase-type esterase domain-containing protein n=1 Tax=Exophiala aquamarina CBS 119918 TaxID=1182545 RepID=A0A072P9S8_9EURO|nr:uncharacterized protein A1O9_11515 [Exophiala aquamarina CBS 119918]KEF52275.1 hypothetical protein A1O9_11515 [Exophiala aquamarina CBS 119918]